MNLLAPLNTEALISQNTLPLKAADAADGKNSGSFSDCLDGIRTNTSNTVQTVTVEKKTQKAGNEKDENAGSDTDKSPIRSDNPLAAVVCTELCPVLGDTNTETKDTADTAEGSADNTVSSGLAGQENDKPTVSADMAALSKTPLQRATKGNQHKSTAEIAGTIKTDSNSSPVNIKKESIPVTDHTVEGAISVTGNTEKETIHLTENTVTKTPSSVYNNASEKPVTGESNGPQSSDRRVSPDTVQSVRTKATVSANTSFQQTVGSTENNLNGTSGDKGKISPKFSNTGLTDNRVTGEKEPYTGYAKIERPEKATTGEVANTVLTVTPKMKEPHRTPVQKGDAVDFSSQGKSADKMQDGQKDETTASSAKITELSDGSRSQSDKNGMQSVKLDQIVPRKEGIAGNEQDEIRKNQTEHTYKTNEKSGELFSLQDSNATASNGVKAVHQKPEVADISRLSREDFVITKKDNTSIELTIEPEGMGKLNIHLSLDKGAIHARINASENIGKDFIDRNLNNILQTLSDDGINIGSFSINLRDRKNEFIEEEQDSKTYRGPAIESPLPVAHAGNSTINIFV